MNNSQRVKNIYLNSCPLYMKIIITLLLFNLFPIVGYSATLTVPEQYSSIQSAINASADQDTVLVSPGFYQENISFNGKDIVVTSTYIVEQDSLMIGSTIIDGNNNGSVVLFNNGESQSAVLQGFTLQDGNGNYADPDENGTFYTYGGGIYCKSSSPTLKDLVVTNNTGDEGGGGGIFCYEASPIITGCFITNNTTNDVGGGLYARNESNPVINYTDFIGNEADLGAGCYLKNESTPSLTNVDFISNVAANSGGGIVLKDDADAIMDHVTLVDNIAEGLGGGIYINNADPSVNYALVSSNVSSAGGGVYIRNNSDPTFNHTTVAYNTSGFEGSGVYLRDNSNLLVTNSVLWGNGNDQVYFRDSGDDVSLNISYSLVENGQSGIDVNNNGDLDWGLGMLQSDPYFCNGEGGIFSLRENSPCINAGDDGEFIGCFSVGCGPINTGPVWYVGELGNDSSDGSIETPFFTIQRAIDACTNGDTIRLSPGNYIESVDFNAKDIVLESRAYELIDPLLISQTVISPGVLGGSCMELIGQDAANLEIKGITFSGGQSQIGGGIYVENSSPKLTGIIVENNTAEVGGGIYFNNADVELDHVIIRNNGSNFGGGLYATGSIIRLANVSIDSNIAYWGAGLYSENSSVEIETTNLRFNHAYIEGGGIYQNGNSVTISETAITSNEGLDFGGALVCYMGIMDIDRCTIAGNNANYGSAFNLREAVVSLSNSIVWENGENTVYSSSGSQASMVDIGYTNFYGGENYLSSSPSIILEWGEGNLNIDPLFCNSDDNDFALQQGSACLSASDTFESIGAFSGDCGQQLMIDHEVLPVGFKLYQNHPNPFNPVTSIHYKVNDPGLVKISVFSISGSWVIDLVHARHIKGQYSTTWSGKDHLGNQVSSGVYIYRSSLNNKVKSRKMILAK